MFLREIIYNTVSIFKRIAWGFDKFGLRSSVEHLEIMFPKVLSIPIEEQEYYVDFPTKCNVNEEWFIEGVLNTDFSIAELQSSNTTSIGNLAYVAINCKNEKAAKIAYDAIEKIKEHFKTRI